MPNSIDTGPVEPVDLGGMPVCYTIHYDVAAPKCRHCFARAECKDGTFKLHLREDIQPPSEEIQLIARIQKKIAADEWRNGCH